MKNVAIIGGATPQGDMPIPWDSPEWERWCCNALYTKYPTDRPTKADYEKTNGSDAWDHATYWINQGIDEQPFPVTAWFQLHTPEYMERHWHDGWGDHQIWLEREHPFPIYMQKRYRRFPSSVAFPRRLVESLPRGRYQMFSFSWMFCMALAQGAKRIGLFGCGAGRGEPLAARACMEYWIGYAEGQGVDVVLSGTPTLFRSHHQAEVYSDLQYAYDDEPAFELGNGWRDVR
jgi:hypothetical protein